MRYWGCGSASQRLLPGGCCRRHRRHPSSSHHFVLTSSPAHLQATDRHTATVDPSFNPEPVVLSGTEFAGISQWLLETVTVWVKSIIIHIEVCFFSLQLPQWTECKGNIHPLFLKWVDLSINVNLILWINVKRSQQVMQFCIFISLFVMWVLLHPRGWEKMLYRNL